MIRFRIVYVARITQHADARNYYNSTRSQRDAVRRPQSEYNYA